MNTVDIGAARRIAGESGPEDLMVRVAVAGTKVAGGEDLHTAASAGRIVIAAGADLSRLDHKSLADATRYAALAVSTRPDGSGPGDLIGELATKRMLCAKADYAHELTLRSTYAQRAAEEAAATRLEKLRCAIKVTRAVDSICRAEMATFQLCRDRFGAASGANCAKEQLAFDRCTEEF